MQHGVTQYWLAAQVRPFVPQEYRWPASNVEPPDEELVLLLVLLLLLVLPLLPLLVPVAASLDVELDRPLEPLDCCCGSRCPSRPSSPKVPRLPGPPVQATTRRTAEAAEATVSDAKANRRGMGTLPTISLSRGVDEGERLA